MVASLVAVLALVSAPVAGATNVSGIISADTTWTAANSPYVMTGNVSVNAGVTLTIEPGVTVQGNAAARTLIVNGSLSAVGTESAGITFTSTSDSAPGQWTGVTFNSGAGTGTFKYVSARFGGGGVGGDISGMLKFLWTLDPAGNPTKTQTTRGTTDSYDAYEYDDRNRLTASCFDVPSAATNCSGAANKIGYGYDKVSNRTEETRTGTVGNTGTITSTYNDADQLTQTDDGTTTTAFTYDDNGNLASKGNRGYTYNLADELTSTTAGVSDPTTSYAYDGDGNRVSSSTTSGGADLRYLWDPQAESGIPELALERESDGDLVRRYLNGPLGAISMTTGAGTFYFHRDPLGSVTDLTDASGNPQCLGRGHSSVSRALETHRASGCRDGEHCSGGVRSIFESMRLWSRMLS